MSEAGVLPSMFRVDLASLLAFWENNTTHARSPRLPHRETTATRFPQTLILYREK